jgi:predicted  nucleic acid-binding Zn-ribbon protein
MTKEQQPPEKETEINPTDEVRKIHPIAPIADPKLALPEHLQTTSYDEDIWSRVKNSPLRPPSATTKSIRENAEFRDAFRAVMAASSEREKEVLLHSQARVFSTVLAAIGRHVSFFLNKPLTPKSWQTEGKTNSENKNGWATDWLNYLLTPKTLLLIAALSFGVIAGWSQLQLHNLKGAVESYETSKKALEAEIDTLNSRINGFDTVKNEYLSKASDAEAKWSAEESKNLQLSTEIANLKNELENERAKLQSTAESLAAAKAGTVVTQQQLEQNLAEQKGLIAELQGKLTASQAAVAKAEARADANRSQFNELNKLVRTAQDQRDELNVKLGQNEVEIAQLRTSLNEVKFADETVKAIENLTRRYQLIRSADLQEYIDRYNYNKSRHSN